MSGRSELHVDVHDGRGPHALFVHGILSSRAQWLANLDALRAVCRPVVVELWGHGRSPEPPDAEAYSPDAYVDAFERVRRSLRVESWVLIGQSLGAALTLRYALGHPERVIGQVFTNSASALADEAWRQRMRNMAPGLAERVERGGHSALEAMPIHPARARRLPAEIRDALVGDARLLRPGAVARTLLHTVPDSSVRDRVGDNRVDSLLVAGTKESEFDEPRAFAAANMPHLRVVEAPAGHAVNIQAASRFNQAVEAFIGPAPTPPG